MEILARERPQALREAIGLVPHHAQERGSGPTGGLVRPFTGGSSPPEDHVAASGEIAGGHNWGKVANYMQ